VPSVAGGDWPEERDRRRRGRQWRMAKGLWGAPEPCAGSSRRFTVGGVMSGGGAGDGRSSRPAVACERGGGGARDGRRWWCVRGLSSEERGWARERMARMKGYR
jgi:hypothetical protein